MDKIKEILSKSEFSKKLAIWIVLFVQLVFVVAIILNTLMDIDLSIYTGQLIAPLLTVLGFYFGSKTLENVTKIVQSDRFGNPQNPDYNVGDDYNE